MLLNPIHTRHRRPSVMWWLPSMEARWGLGGRGEAVRAKIIQLHLADGVSRADIYGKTVASTGVARIRRGHPEDIVHQ
jgi:hypothetical protein